MKKLIILFLLLPTLCWGGMIIQKFTSTSAVDYTLYASCDSSGTIDYPTSLSMTLNNGAAIVTGGYLNSFIQTDGDYHGNGSIPISDTYLDIDGVWRVKMWIRTDGTESYIFRIQGQTGDGYAYISSLGSINFYYGSDYVAFFDGGGEFNLSTNTWYHFEFYVDETNNVQGIRCLNRNCADDGAGTCESEESISTSCSGEASSIELGGAGTGTSNIDVDEVYIYDTESD